MITQLRGSAKKLGSSCMARLPQPIRRAASAAPIAPSSRALIGRRAGQSADHRCRRVGRHLAQRAQRRRARRVDLRLGFLQLLLQPLVQRRDARRGLPLRRIQRRIDRGLRLGPRARRGLGHLLRRLVGTRLGGLRRLQVGGDVPRALLEHRADLRQADARQQHVQHGEDDDAPHRPGWWSADWRSRAAACPPPARRPAAAAAARCSARPHADIRRTG